VSGAEPTTLLPPLTQFDVEIVITDFLFLKLAAIGDELNTVDPGTFAPRLARQWTFEDSLTIRFALDPAARWHDGRPVTGADVVFTFDVYRDTLVNALARQRLDRITSVTAVDSHTVVFRFSTAYPERFYDAVYHMRILPRHVLDTIPRSSLTMDPVSRDPVGNGPFRLTRWVTGEAMDLEADSTFFLGRPGPRRIVWRFTADPATAVTQVLAGEADYLNAMRSDDVPRVRADDELRVILIPSLAYAYIAFNLRDPANPERPHPLFGGREVRRALSMAVDREGIVRAVRGEYGYVPQGPVTRPLWIWDDGLAALSFDTAGARQILDDQGWRDTDKDGVLDRDGRRFRFELIVPSTSNDRQRSAVIVQDQMRRIGVEMTVTPLDVPTWIDRAQNGRADAYYGARTQDPSPASIDEAWSSRGIGEANWGRYVNREVDRLLVEALESFDTETARATWHEAIARINADAPAIWVYSPISAAAVHRRFEGVSIRPDQWGSTIWLWRVSPSGHIDRDLLN
jgi:peptide/nickel transport system substrate-binding protein